MTREQLIAGIQEELAKWADGCGPVLLRACLALLTDQDEPKLCAICGVVQPCKVHGRTPVTDADFEELRRDVAAQDERAWRPITDATGDKVLVGWYGYPLVLRGERDADGVWRQCISAPILSREEEGGAGRHRVSITSRRCWSETPEKGWRDMSMSADEAAAMRQELQEARAEIARLTQESNMHARACAKAVEAMCAAEEAKDAAEQRPARITGLKQAICNLFHGGCVRHQEVCQSHFCRHCDHSAQHADHPVKHPFEAKACDCPVRECADELTAALAAGEPPQKEG